jgi:anti-sigma B factor antagonist
MTMDERIVGSVVVLDLGGTLTVNEAVRFRDKIHSLVFDGRRAIVLNMKELSYMDSTGLGALVGAYTTVTKAGGRIGLVNLTSRVSNVMTITKLLTVFDVFDSEALAVVQLSALVERPSA